MKKVMLATIALSTVNFAFAEDAVVSEAATPAYENAFDSFYLGLGIGGSFVKYDAKDAPAEVTKRCNRFIGSAVLGAGKTFAQKFYIGAEVLADFTKTKTRTIDGGDFLKYQGVTPQFDVRFGYVTPCWNTLFYGKMGISFNKLHVHGDEGTTTKNKAGFVLGLGVEKMFCKKFSARVEGDYNFGGSYEGLKFNKGFTIRALVAYNIKY